MILQSDTDIVYPVNVREDLSAGFVMTDED
jgi:hypothetical protein